MLSTPSDDLRRSTLQASLIALTGATFFVVASLGQEATASNDEAQAGIRVYGERIPIPNNQGLIRQLDMDGYTTVEMWDTDEGIVVFATKRGLSRRIVFDSESGDILQETLTGDNMPTFHFEGQVSGYSSYRELFRFAPPSR